MTDLSRKLGSFWARVGDIVRRFRVTDDADPLRRAVEGFPGETDDVEIFQGVGHAARPPADAETEAIAVAVNARDHHVIVATRDGDTVRAVVDAVGLEADETLIYTSQTVVKLLADGSVEIRSLGGAAVSLATREDADALNARIDALEFALNNHGHAGGSGAPVTPGAVPPAATSATVSGTSVLRGE